MRKWSASVVVLFSSIVLAVACGDSSSPTSSSNPMSSPPPTANSPTDNPSFASDIQPIFERNGCTNGACHGGAVSAGLDLRSGASYNNLVNVQATSEPITRVIPGNADGSYLVIKLEGRQAVGSRMPLGGQALNTTDLTNIKNWINRGANNN